MMQYSLVNGQKLGAAGSTKRRTTTSMPAVASSIASVSSVTFV